MLAAWAASNISSALTLPVLRSSMVLPLEVLNGRRVDPSCLATMLTLPGRTISKVIRWSPISGWAGFLPM